MLLMHLLIIDFFLVQFVDLFEIVQMLILHQYLLSKLVLELDHIRGWNPISYADDRS